MFELCCETRKTESYSLKHDPIPITLSGDMERIVKEILWYVPNIDSYQAPKNDLIGDKVYDDFSFTYILNAMGMDESSDVLWLEPKDSIDEATWDFYENEVCVNCQKLIIVRCKSLSKTNDLLRCIRNCIAHGHFTIVDDYLIGFNLDTSRNKPYGLKKAIIKIKPALLLQALRSLMSPRAKEKLVGFAFERAGYTVYDESDIDGAWRFDLMVEKDGAKYAIEIKDYRGKRYVHLEDIKHFIDNGPIMAPPFEIVYFIDTSYITKEVKQFAEQLYMHRIVDLKQVKQLLADKPVDILV